VTDEESAFKTVAELGYPVVVRPSYVIGGRAMQVVYSDEELRKYLREAVSLTREHPVLIDKYIQGKEVEVDAIGDGENILIPGIMEHIERTGVHSGDSMTVYPPHTLEQRTIDTIIDYTERISKALHVIGLVNIQYAFDGKNVYVIEVNPRASRTVPILSKVTGVPMIKLAVSAMLGKKLKDFEYGTGLYKHVGKYAVKVPVFSGAKLTDVDVTLGPEMKSTGEVLGIDHELDKAIYKGFLAANIRIPVEGGAYFALRDTERTEHTLNVVKMYQTQGYKMYCSEWTYDYFIENGIDAVKLNFEDAKDMIGAEINLFINVPSIANRPEREDFILRRKAIERGLPVLTCMDTAEAFMTAVKLKKVGTKLDYCVLNSR